MKVKWLVEPEIFDNDAKLLLDTLKKFGIEHEIWPFGRLYGDFVKCFKDTDCVVFYGSFQFASVVRRTAKWIPGVYCNLPKFDCQYYYPRFGKYLLNSEYAMLPLGDLKRREDWIFGNFGLHDEVFVKPAKGDKSFTGKVVKSADWDKDLRMFELRADPEALTVIAKPAEISHEWRIFISEGKVITSSQYKVTHPSNAPGEVLNYAQEVLNSVKYRTDPVWTLDICRANGELKVLEIGSFSCAGLYACDPEKVINAVNEVALKEYLSYEELDR